MIIIASKVIQKIGGNITVSGVISGKITSGIENRNDLKWKIGFWLDNLNKNFGFLLKVKDIE